VTVFDLKSVVSDPVVAIQKQSLSNHPMGCEIPAFPCQPRFFEKIGLGTGSGKQVSLLAVCYGFKPGFPLYIHFPERANAAGVGIGRFAVLITVCRHQSVA